MTPLVQKILRALAREDVNECALVTGRFGASRGQDGQWTPLEEKALTSDDIFAILSAFGGDRHLERLGEAPIQWQFRSRGVGVVVASATQRGDDVRARFLVKEREISLAAPPMPKDLAAPKEGHGHPNVLRDAHHHPHHGPDDPQAVARKMSLKPPVIGGEPEVERPKSNRPGRKSVAPGKRNSKAPPPPAAAQPVPPIELADKQAALMLDRSADDFLFDTGKRNSASNPAGSLGALLIDARKRGASDLHVIAERPPLVRIAGELAAQGDPLDPDRVELMLMPLVPPRLRAELAETGSCDFALSDPKLGRARVNITRQRTGYKGCFRLIPSEVPSLQSLGLPPEIAKATHHHQGLIVVTGPTGHGKTSTLAAIVDHINATTTHHVITVEDPVEYLHPRKRAMMSQREVGSCTKSFARALKGSLREDPDVIVVGELRDLETVAMAVAASETGHLVLGTMNTPSAAKTIDRLIDLFPPGDQQQVRGTLAGGLKLIVGQRLVPSKDRKRVHAAAELLTGTVALWNLIREEKTYQIPSLQQRGKALGIIRLDDSLAGLVKAGLVNEADALAFAESPETFTQAVRGQPAAPPPPEPKAGLLGNMFGKKGA